VYHRRILAIAADQEIRERFGRRVQLRPDAAAGHPQVGQRDARQQPRRRLDEIL